MNTYRHPSDHDGWWLRPFTKLDSNRDAFRACRDMAAGIRDERLLVLDGNVCAGKTHLLFSMSGPGVCADALRPVLSSGEQLMFWLADRLHGKDPVLFTEEERSCALLLVDDLHFFSGKERCQVEMAQCFAGWIHQGVRIAFTCADYHADLPKLHRCLKSLNHPPRHCRIHPPTESETLQVLRDYTAACKMGIPQQSLARSASRANGNIRKAIGELVREQAMAELY